MTFARILGAASAVGFLYVCYRSRSNVEAEKDDSTAAEIADDQMRQRLQAGNEEGKNGMDADGLKEPGTQLASAVWKLEGEDRFSAAGGREIDEDEIRRILDRDNKPLPPFWKSKYENEAKRMWDVFYRRNGDRFYKDRHYLEKEWAELRPGSGYFNVFEVGCGVGNATFPILRQNDSLRIWSCDFALNAINLLQTAEEYDRARCTAFVADITQDPLSELVGGEATMDLCLMIFVLSAIAPAKMISALTNIASTLRVGGVVCFRDYALYDMAQLKMAEPRKHKLCDNCYVRQDGTMAYYFEQKELEDMFDKAGFDVLSCELHRRAVSNRKEGTTMHRRWLHARFVKRAPA